MNSLWRHWKFLLFACLLVLSFNPSLLSQTITGMPAKSNNMVQRMINRNVIVSGSGNGGQLFEVTQTSSATACTVPAVFLADRVNCYLSFGDCIETTFVMNGFKYTESGLSSQSRDVDIQSEGKIVSVCVSDTLKSGSGQGIMLIQYNFDGSLDKTYVNNGIVSVTLPDREDSYARVVQLDGKIVVVGKDLNVSGLGGDTLLVLRFNPDGTLDSTFGTERILPDSNLI